VRQAEQLVHGASAAIAELEQRITRREDFISTLLGNNPGDVSRGRPLVDQAHAPELPAGTAVGAARAAA
jgi:multidrug efflux system outer membrane protein